jgi:hypothetical protein
MPSSLSTLSAFHGILKREGFNVETRIMIRRKTMRARQYIENTLAHHLRQLQRLEPQATRPQYNLEQFMLQRNIGQYCYLAEEMLETQDLNRLKCSLRLDEAEWWEFKQQGIWGMDIMMLEEIQQRGGEDESAS